MARPSWEKLRATDRACIWHPYASAHPGPEVFPVVSASGVRLQLADGRELLDGMASWWCAIHGYNHPALNRAVQEQLENMSHVMFGGLTHPPAVKLAQLLTALTPAPLERVFFSDSGSVAVEVALKMALQYWYSVGNPGKQKFVALRNGYHGDTFGAMAVCDPVTGMHHLFGEVLPRHLFAPAPDCPFGTPCPDGDMVAITDLLSRHHRDIAAVIVEPVVQGAGGMRFYSADYLVKLRALCDAFDVLLIFDEIATGFGRTGKLFGCETTGISQPDQMTFAKQLSSAYYPISAAVIRGDLYEAMREPSAKVGVFGHGYTYSGHPVACAAALKTLEIYERDNLYAHAAEMGAYLQQRLAPLRDHERVGEVRGAGLIAAIELVEDRASRAPATELARRTTQLCQDNGLIVRNVAGCALALCPPLIITREQVDELVDKLTRSLEAAL